MLIGPMRVIGVIGEVDDLAHIGTHRLAHPDPDELVLLDHVIAAHASILGDAALPRHRHAFAAAVEDQAVIAALDAACDHLTKRERRRAVTAAIDERRGAALLVAE